MTAFQRRDSLAGATSVCALNFFRQPVGRLICTAAATLLALLVPQMLTAQTLKIASPQRGSWEGAIPELGQQAGIFKKHGLDLEILYTHGGGETLQVVVSGAVDIV